jgi:hypothetical protein
MEALRITHQEILRLTKIANQSDDEIRKHHLNIRPILIARRKYAMESITYNVNSENSNLRLLEVLNNVRYLDTQLKMILSIK